MNLLLNILGLAPLKEINLKENIIEINKNTINNILNVNTNSITTETFVTTILMIVIFLFLFL